MFCMAAVGRASHLSGYLESDQDRGSVPHTAHDLHKDFGGGAVAMRIRVPIRGRREGQVACGCPPQKGAIVLCVITDVFASWFSVSSAISVVFVVS